MKTTKMKLMKTKLLLTAALLGAASLSAQAGVHFGFSFGLPVPVVVMAPAVCAPAITVAVPACLGPDYVWATGYWSVNGYNRVWVPGCWQYRPAHIVYGRGYGHEHGWYRY